MEHDLYKSTIGKVWKRARITKQVKRVFVAEALGMSVSNIAKIEQQKYHVTLTDIIRYCKAIGYCPAHFLKQVLDELPPPPRKRAVIDWMKKVKTIVCFHFFSMVHE